MPLTSGLRRVSHCAGFAERLQARQVAELEQFERRAATGGDVVDVVVEPELGERRGGVAATDDRERLGVGDGLGEGAGAGREPLVLEHPHRPVPEHGAGVHHDVAELGGRAGPDVEALGAVGQARAVGLQVAGRVEPDDVGGQVDRLRRLVEQAPAGVDLIGLEQRVADRVAAGGEKREAHRPADRQGVHRLEQRLDDAQLVGDLGPAEDGDERAVGLAAQAQQHLDLALQQAPGGARNVLRRADDRGVGAVRRAERVVDVAVDAVDELGDEGVVVALLARVVAQVVEELDAGRELGEAGADRIHRVLRVRLALRPAEVAGGHDVRPAIGQPLDRRQRGTDAEVVGDACRCRRRARSGR